MEPQLGCYCALVSETQDQGPHLYKGCPTDLIWTKKKSTFGSVFLKTIWKKDHSSSAERSLMCAALK